MNDNVDAARIVEVLNRHRVAYVIIGGYAAELHEWPISRRRATSTSVRQPIERTWADSQRC